MLDVTLVVEVAAVTVCTSGSLRLGTSHPCGLPGLTHGEGIEHAAAGGELAIDQQTEQIAVAPDVGDIQVEPAPRRPDDQFVGRGGVLHGADARSR